MNSRRGVARALPVARPECAIDLAGTFPYMRPLRREAAKVRSRAMKVRSSLKSLKTRHRDCKLVRRKGRIYVINKTDPRYKAKQG